MQTWPIVVGAAVVPAVIAPVVARVSAVPGQTGATPVDVEAVAVRAPGAGMAGSALVTR
jgi:hypothetical protein